MIQLETFKITRFIASRIFLIALPLIMVIMLTLLVQIPSPMLMFSAECDRTTDIYTMDLRVNLVINLTGNPVYEFAPSWSPDGSQIAFMSYDVGQLLLFVMNSNKNNMRTVRLEDAYNYGFSSWSPEGTRLAISFREGDLSSADEHIHIYEVTDGNAFPEIDRIENASQPAWSPDGRSIIFISNRSGDSDIYLMDMESREVRNLTEDQTMDMFPVWSPDGTEIAFASDRISGNWYLYRMNINTGVVQRLTQNAPSFYPTWSNEGNRIAFSSTTLGASGIGSFELFVMNADGSGMRQLTRMGCFVLTASWRP